MDPVSGAILCAAIAGLCSILVAVLTRPNRVKIDETHRQLTTNHHVSSPPTALDKLDSIQQTQQEHALILLDVKETLNRHIEWHMGKK
jgi:hypothetical protein